MQTILEEDLSHSRRIRGVQALCSIAVVVAAEAKVVQQVLPAIILAMSGSICTNQVRVRLVHDRIDTLCTATFHQLQVPPQSHNIVDRHL